MLLRVWDSNLGMTSFSQPLARILLGDLRHMIALLLASSSESQEQWLLLTETIRGIALPSKTFLFILLCTLWLV